MSGSVKQPLARPRKHDMKLPDIPYNQLKEWAIADRRTPAAQIAYILDCLVHNRAHQLHVPRTMLVKDSAER